MLFYEAQATIEAPIDVVWSVITDAPAYTAWDSGITAVDGDIEDGERITVHAAVNPDRAFKVKVAFGVTDGPGRSMRWKGGMPLGLFTGTRLFRLTEPAGRGTTRLHVREEYTGPLAGMIGKSIPDLGPSFGQYVEGAKTEAERRRNT